MDPALLHPACLPISVSDDDPFYNNIEITMSCITLVRSIAGPRLDCSLGYADQVIFSQVNNKLLQSSKI